MDAWKKIAAVVAVLTACAACEGTVHAGSVTGRINAAGAPKGINGLGRNGNMQNPARLVASKARSSGLSKGTTGMPKAKSHAQHQVMTATKSGGQQKNNKNRH